MTVLSRTPVVETVSSAAAFEGLVEEWDDLVCGMPRPSPFLLHAWLSEWWRHYGDSGELGVHVVRQDGRLLGALPLMVGVKSGARVVRFMGGRQSALADLLLASEADDSVAALLAGQLAASDHHLVDLYGIPVGSRIVTALGRSHLHVIARIEAPVLDLRPSWEAVYEAKASAKTRSLHRRRRRQLAALGRLEVSVARTPAELEAALEEAFRLHALRWAGRPDGSGFVTPTGMRFHRAVIHRLAELDVPRIVTLTLDGRAIAFHYFFAFEGCMYVHRLAFDPALSRYSPGLVNTLDTIQVASDEGLTRVEFLGGAERYKRELADRFEPLYQALGLASGIRGHTLLQAELGVIRLRMRLKRSPRLRRLYFDRFAPIRLLATRSRNALKP
ncbi:MAG TPA: GNAT family N-acetyltransferase [Gaiellaceae bacterium]|nr:GNAT family N-acetyltransferase [Gaiellaceae bacterium]